MKKSLLVLLLTTIFILLVTADYTLATKLPILKKTSKQLVRAIGNNAVTNDTFVILGRKGDISSVKSRTDRLNRLKYQVNILPDLSREISSRSAIIIDAETGETIFADAADTPRQPASTIKILTGMIAIKSLENSEMVRVSRHAARMPRSKIYLDYRKSYRADDLINAVLLSSANDASVALAEKIAGSEREFAKMMNLRARLWGARNTVCKTATGLTAKGQKSTARDLAMIFRHAMRDNEFINRMKKKKIRTSFGEVLTNHNKALNFVKGAVAGKTGYTRAARQTYVGQFTRDNSSIIVAIMGSKTMWQDIRKLVSYGFKWQDNLQLSRTTLQDNKKRVAELR